MIDSCRFSTSPPFRLLGFFFLKGFMVHFASTELRAQGQAPGGHGAVQVTAFVVSSFLQ